MATITRKRLSNGNLSDSFYVLYRDNGRQRWERCVTPDGVPLTHKPAAQAYLKDWLKSREMGAVGLVDPFRPHLDKPAADHLEAFLAAKRPHVSDRHHHELGRVLGLILDGAGVKLLRDFTAAKIKAHLDTRAADPTFVLSHQTLNRYRSYLTHFANWLVDNGRLKDTPFAKRAFPTWKPRKAARTRAAYTPSMLRRLVAAARDYPLTARSVNRGGRPRADGSRPTVSPSKLTPEAVAKFTRQGADRSLMYRLLIATGLRLGELSRVVVGERHGRTLMVPGHKLKVVAVGHVRFKLPPTLAADLEAHLADSPAGAPLVTVPDASNLSGLHARHLTLAGLPAADKYGRRYDVHAIRKTVNLWLETKGVPERSRKRYLRHKAADITNAHYADVNGHHKPQNGGKVGRLLAKLDAYLVAPVPAAAG